MGNSNTSFEENLQNKSSTIQSQHLNLDQEILRINAEADRIIALILERGYNDRDKICQKIGYQKIDELSGLFQIQTLNDIRYKLGIIPENTPELETNKTKVCLDIVNFYVKKINLITNIQKELPNCRNMEKEIYDDLTNKLNSNSLNNDEWLEVYNKLEKFNKDIKKRYDLIERELERVRKARTMSELDAIAYTTNTILNDTNTICKRHENNLFQYSNKAQQMGNMNSPQVREPVVREQSFSPQVIESRQPVVREQSFRPPVREQSFRPQVIESRQPPVREQSFSPQFREQSFREPVREQSFRPQVREQVREQSFRPQVREQSFRPQVREEMFTEEFIPVVPQIKEQIFTEEFSPSPIREYKPVIKQSYVAPPIREKKTVTFGEPEIHTFVKNVPVTRTIIQEQKKELGTMPVEQFPEYKSSIKYNKQVKLTGEKTRTSNGTMVNIPSRVEITRTIPKEHFNKLHKTLSPGEKILCIEPVYENKLKMNGVPVRAIQDYIPKGPNEIALQEGQATLYLGTGKNGWSRVRHSNKMEGYVPHTYLSK